jgi:hypothetical protein
MAESPREVVESVEIRADRGTVWSAVSDPSSYGRWSPENTGTLRPHPGPWAVGDTFTGKNRAWLPWVTSCRVVSADEVAGVFAFDVALVGVPIARWAYELDELPDGGVRVTERWTDRRDGALGAVVSPSGVFVGRGIDAATRNRATMRTTLDRLKADLEGNAASA